jgi:hypothetical protein
MHKIRSLGLDKHAYVFSMTDHGAWQGLSINARFGRTFAVPGRC